MSAKRMIQLNKFSDYIPNVPLSPPNSEDGNVTENSHECSSSIYMNSQAQNKSASSIKKDIPRKFSKLYPNLLNNTSTDDGDFNCLVQKFSPTKGPFSENRTIKCKVCDKDVLYMNIKKHMFFGRVKCLDCGLNINHCSDFKIFISKSNDTSARVCVHKNFSWIDDPIIYLQWLLTETKGKSPRPFNLQLRSYIKHLRELESILPWKTAMESCNNFINLCDKPVQISPKMNNAVEQKKSVKRKNNSEQIDLPEDGFYLISQTPIEECPSCYEKLNLLKFVFNARNGLIHTQCRTCSLLIYFVLQPPDGSQPKIRILQDTT